MLFDNTFAFESRLLNIESPLAEVVKILSVCSDNLPETLKRSQSFLKKNTQFDMKTAPKGATDQRSWPFGTIAFTVMAFFKAIIWHKFEIFSDETFEMKTPNALHNLKWVYLLQARICITSRCVIVVLKCVQKMPTCHVKQILT